MCVVRFVHMIRLCLCIEYFETVYTLTRALMFTHRCVCVCKICEHLAYVSILWCTRITILFSLLHGITTTYAQTQKHTTTSRSSSSSSSTHVYDTHIHRANYSSSFRLSTFTTQSEPHTCISSSRNICVLLFGHNEIENKNDQANERCVIPSRFSHSSGSCCGGGVVVAAAAVAAVTSKQLMAIHIIVTHQYHENRMKHSVIRLVGRLIVFVLHEFVYDPEIKGPPTTKILGCEFVCLTVYLWRERKSAIVCVCV